MSETPTMAEQRRADPVSGPYWEGAADGRLRLQWCARCDRAHHYPRARCPFCGGDELAWRDASGHGTVYSYTEQPRRDGESSMIILVDLAEGPRLLSHLVGDRTGLTVGSEVQAVWGTAADGTDLVTFELADLRD